MERNKEQTPRILVVDDEIDICEIIAFNLSYEGYEAQVATSAEEALSLLQQSQVDLIILDVMMGGMSGFQMADHLRKQDNDVPIIFLTAKDSENDLLTGLTIGGDDYIKKPFSIKEVVARVRSVLRRTELSRSSTKQSDDVHSVEQHGEVMVCGPLLIDTDNMTVTVDDKQISVTKTEYDIIALLARNVGRPFSRTEILDYVWHDNGIVLERTVDVHIARLRKKLGEHGDMIANRVGFGYVMKLPR